MPNLKLYGLQRTCTNITRWLLATNTDAEVWHDGPEGACAWKHGPPAAFDFYRGYLLCVKHPLAWLDSMMRYRPAPIPTLAKMWNERGQEFLEFCLWNPCEIVRHEDIVADSKDVVGRIAFAFGLEVSAEFQATDYATLRAGDESISALSGQPFDRFHYEEKRYLDRFKGVAASTLDAGIMEMLGYECD